MTTSNVISQWLDKLKQADKERDEEINKPVVIDEKKSLKELRKKEEAEKLAIKEKEGFVYILRSENNCYKIGKAKDLQSRVTSWKHEFPIKIDLIHSFACHDRTLVENNLHNKYSKKRLQREWYKLNDEDISWLLSVKDYELG